MGWNWMMFGGVTMLFFWGGLFLLGVLTFRAIQAPRSMNSWDEDRSRQTALEIINERYAT